MEITELRSVWEKMKLNSVSLKEKTFPIGCDGMSKSNFEENLDCHLNEIIRKVNTIDSEGITKYSFGKLVYYERKKSSGGTRKIYLPRLKDQLLFKWLHFELVTAAKKKEINLQTKSPLEVVKQFRSELNKYKNPVVVRTDITSFFDSVPRDKVVDLALKLELSNDAKNLLIVWSKKIIGRPFWTTGKLKDEEVFGLPQGLSISATLAELWGDEIEKRMLPHARTFRFVDDITFICENKKNADEKLIIFKSIIEDMGLSISENKTQISALSEGVHWLGMKHYEDAIFADLDRIEKWAKRFIFIRKEFSLEYKNNPLLDKNELLSKFYFKVKQEIKGKTSARPQWYSIVNDVGQWKELDRKLHAQFKILHKQLNIPLSLNAKLPSIHKQMISRFKNR